MSLGIYSSPHEDYKLDASSPFTITFDGRIGGAQDRIIYVRNDDTARWYSDIQIQPVYSGSGTNIVNGERTGWRWKLIEKDVPPTGDEWSQVAPGVVLSLSSDIGSSLLADIVTFLPVWVRAVVPSGQRIQAITDVVLRLTSTEGLI